MNIALTDLQKRKKAQGRRSHQKGLESEALVAGILERLGFVILARRLRTPHGEIDLLAANADLLLAVEVKKRKTMTDGAEALSPRQKQRLISAFEWVWDTATEWHRSNARFDLFLVDERNQTRCIKDALRQF